MFGFVARGEAGQGSDADVLVFTGENHTPHTISLALAYSNRLFSINLYRVPTCYFYTTLESVSNNAVPEDFPTELCEHTPYGCSKLAGDLYAQDYAQTYGLKTGIFRMSCTYGERQFGVEDQGWVAWFTIATLLNKSITIYGDGKQVRDVLNVSDLVRVYDTFVNSNLKHGVFNVGGGPDNTLSLLELLNMLDQRTGKRSKINFSDWRLSDQKVYISNISKAQEKLRWTPRVSPKEGVERLAHWVLENEHLLK